jgi:putative ABC transport system permease protein
VAAAAPLLRAVPSFRIEEGGREAEPWPLAGYDARFLSEGAPALSSRHPDLASDDDAWQAVLNNPGQAIVSDFFLSDAVGPPERLVDPGDEVVVVNEATGQSHRFTVAGILGTDFPLNGVLASRNLVADLMGSRAVSSRHYVDVRAGAEPDEVARRLTDELVAHGVDATPFRAVIDEELTQQTGFFRLMQGFLSLGLVIGIAGLGVVMVRAVRERRWQIGMLRAMGFGRGVVRRAFLVEAAFVAAQGIVIGVALGLVTSYSLLSTSEIFGDSHLDFGVPWLALGAVLAAPLLTSLVAAAVPATRAAAVRPAAALRLAD